MQNCNIPVILHDVILKNLRLVRGPHGKMVYVLPPGTYIVPPGDIEKIDLRPPGSPPEGRFRDLNPIGAVRPLPQGDEETPKGDYCPPVGKEDEPKEDPF